MRGLQGFVGGVDIVADVPSGGGTDLEVILENLLENLGFDVDADLNMDGVIDAADVVTAVNASNESM